MLLSWLRPHRLRIHEALVGRARAGAEAWERKRAGYVQGVVLNEFAMGASEHFGETEGGVGGRGQARDTTFVLEDLFPGGEGHGPLYWRKKDTLLPQYY